jgi:hypothetical protein
MRIVVIAALLVGTVASAQPSDAPIQPPGLTSPAPAPPPIVARYVERRAPLGGEVDESAAVNGPLIATVASWAVMLGGARAGSGAVAGLGFLGTLIAPSTGHWYASDPGLAGLGMRAAGVVGVVAGFAAMIGREDCDYDTECDASTPLAPSVMFFGGLGLYAVGTIYDLATGPSAARRHNARVRAARGLTVAPLVQPGASGLVVAGRF